MKTEHTPIQGNAKRFPRKITKGKSKKTGRAKLRRKPHAGVPAS